MAFVLAHVSDLHVSTFGDTFHDRARIVRRSTQIADASTLRYDVAWSEAGWRVLRERRKPKKLAIVDPEGYAHALPSRRESLSDQREPVARAAEKACRLEARRAVTLAAGELSSKVLDLLAQATPKNSNVRLLRAIPHVRDSGADAVAITGDLTDDGDGYVLIGSAFGKWREQKMLFAIPGNHDRYLFPLASSIRPKPTAESKSASWHAFATELGLAIEPSGAWIRPLPEANAIVVGLDTCMRAQRRFFRHNGSVGADQAELLRNLGQSEAWRTARHRIVLLHHHVVPLPHGIGRRAPSEFGMRLDDSKMAAEVFNATGVTLVLHGHRHISEERQPAGCTFRLLASPSLTLGCRSGDGPSFWRVELGEHVYASRVHIPVESIEEDEDPGVEPSEE